MKTLHLFALTLSLLAMACAGHSKCARSTTAVPSGDWEVPSATAVPGPEVVTEATCTSDAWLLTHYDVERLASGSSPAPGTGYPIACCADGVMPEHSMECELDWPSSDVPGCEIWTEYADTLRAAYPNSPRPERVDANIATLDRWAAEKHHCMTE